MEIHTFWRNRIPTSPIHFTSSMLNNRGQAEHVERFIKSCWFRITTSVYTYNLPQLKIVSCSSNQKGEVLWTFRIQSNSTDALPTKLNVVESF